jgi:hypothetical protein
MYIKNQLLQIKNEILRKNKEIKFTKIINQANLKRNINAYLLLI